jgi:anti-sigma regulatory factor (Ser/Thr protein kinase)
MPTASRPAAHPFSATYRSETAAIGSARQEFGEWLGEQAVTAPLQAEMQLVLSELLANAVAASQDPLDAMAVRSWIDHELTLEVTNPASAVFDTTNTWDYDDPLRPGGRGLLIVESLVDDIAIALPDGTQPLKVLCRRTLADPEEASS